MRGPQSAGPARSSESFVRANRPSAPARPARAADPAPALDLAERLRAAVDALPEIQRQVLVRRFGLDGATPASLQDTADALGIGVRRVRRAETEGLAALQENQAVVSIHAEV